ncbi:hypothetical protein AVEN_138254-1, partial [Araneus ventricosus]
MNRKKRLEFAKKQKDCTVEQWGNIMWSHEPRFSFIQDDGPTRIKREPHEDMDPSCMVPTVQANGG